ncbi:MAG: hypothetical protein WAQ05_19800 [Rubrivivax sp.]
MMVLVRKSCNCSDVTMLMDCGVSLMSSGRPVAPVEMRLTRAPVMVIVVAASLTAVVVAGAADAGACCAIAAPCNAMPAHRAIGVRTKFARSGLQRRRLSWFMEGSNKGLVVDGFRRSVRRRRGVSHECYRKCE